MMFDVLLHYELELRKQKRDLTMCSKRVRVDEDESEYDITSTDVCMLFQCSALLSYNVMAGGEVMV